MKGKRVTLYRLAGPNERLVEGAVVGLDLVLESPGLVCRVTFPEHFGGVRGPDNLPSRIRLIPVSKLKPNLKS